MPDQRMWKCQRSKCSAKRGAATEQDQRGCQALSDLPDYQFGRFVPVLTIRGSGSLFGGGRAGLSVDFGQPFRKRHVDGFRGYVELDQVSIGEWDEYLFALWRRHSE